MSCDLGQVASTFAAQLNILLYDETDQRRIQRGAGTAARAIYQGRLPVACRRLFSSNYELYGELTGRVVYIIGQEAPAYFRYSIDECFVYLDGMEHINLQKWGEHLHTAKDQWKGLRAQQTDSAFCQFESLEYGWRAAFYLLTRTYYYKYRLFTIRAIISKWAPPNENLTSTYIENVCRLTGIPPDEPIGIPSDQPARWMALGVAMAIQENGTDSLDYFAMLRGWGLAREGI